MKDLEKFEATMLEQVRMRLAAQTFPKYSVGLKDKNSMWKVSSAIQKCIRRGHADLAVKYVQAMINGGQGWYIWTRLPVIVLEDVGIANLDLVAVVCMLCKNKEVRKEFDSTQLACLLVDLLAKSDKSRTITDLICSVAYEKGQEDEFWVLVRKVKGNTVFGVQETEKLPEVVQYILEVEEGKKTYGLQYAIPEVMNEIPFFELKENEQPEPFMVAGVPEWTFDQHTSDGKKCAGYVLKAYAPLKEWFDETEKTCPNLNRNAVFGMVFFQEVSAVLNREVDSIQTRLIRVMNDEEEMKAVGITHEKGYELRRIMRGAQFKEEYRKIMKHVIEGV